MTIESQLSPPPDALPAGLAWYCVRSQPKHEHIAAAHLARESDVEVFLPRVTFKRATRSGPARVTEALFPNYLFARFNLSEALRKVQAIRGVSGVVHFGYRWPTIPESVIRDLRTSLGDTEVHVIPDDFAPGDPVRIIGGAFHGLEALVQRAMPGRERVAVLLEFLGRQTTVEISRNWVQPQDDVRQKLTQAPL
jgi:transcriptional antiterminator RfaH